MVCNNALNTRSKIFRVFFEICQKLKKKINIFVQYIFVIVERFYTFCKNRADNCQIIFFQIFLKLSGNIK